MSYTLLDRLASTHYHMFMQRKYNAILDTVVLWIVCAIVAGTATYLILTGD